MDPEWAVVVDVRAWKCHTNFSLSLWWPVWWLEADKVKKGRHKGTATMTDVKVGLLGHFG